MRTPVISLLLLALAWSPAHAAKRDVREVMLEARAARDAGELERAVALLKVAYELRPTPQLLNNLGRMYEQLGQYRSAFDAYKQVADDAQAPLELRNLDGSRMAVLGPKLEKTWLQVAPSTKGAVFVDGKRLTESETGFPEGQRLVVVPSGDGTWFTARRVTFPVGLRTTVSPGPGTSDDGWLDLDLGDGKLTGLRLQGAEVGLDVNTMSRVRLEPGPWTISVDRSDALSATLRLTIGAGATHSLAEALDEQEETSSGGGPSVLSMITAGAGAAMGIVGGVMVLQAEQTRQDLLGALEDTDEEGDVKGITLVDYANQSADADSRTNVGAILIGAGTTVAIGGVVWLILSGGDEPAPEETAAQTRVLWTGSGVLLQGRF